MTESSTPEYQPTPEEVASVEDLIHRVWMQAWAHCTRQQEIAARQGLWPYSPADIVRNYRDWRAYGPGALLPGGKEYREVVRTEDVEDNLRIAHEAFMTLCGLEGAEAATAWEAMEARMRTLMENLPSVAADLDGHIVIPDPAEEQLIAETAAYNRTQVLPRLASFQEFTALADALAPEPQDAALTIDDARTDARCEHGKRMLAEMCPQCVIARNRPAEGTCMLCPREAAEGQELCDACAHNIAGNQAFGESETRRRRAAGGPEDTH